MSKGIPACVGLGMFVRGTPGERWLRGSFTMRPDRDFWMIFFLLPILAGWAVLDWLSHRLERLLWED